MSHSRKSSKESLNGRRTPAPAWAEKGNSSLGDVESQDKDSKSRPSAALEHGVDTRTKFLYLGSWFALNLILTLYNKSLLQGVSHYPSGVILPVLTISAAQIPMATDSITHKLRLDWLLHSASRRPLQAQHLDDSQ